MGRMKLKTLILIIMVGIVFRKFQTRRKCKKEETKNNKNITFIKLLKCNIEQRGDIQWLKK
jgi:hypothetical protein